MSENVDFLAGAREMLRRARYCYDHRKWDAVNGESQMAIAHALIALVERLDEMTKSIGIMKVES